MTTLPGTYTIDFSSAAPLNTALPEPATLLLFGTTAAGLGLARWRQRQQP